MAVDLDHMPAKGPPLVGDGLERHDVAHRTVDLPVVGVEDRAEIRKSVYERVMILYEELQGNSSKTNRMKLDFLETLLVQLSDSASRV
jgi:hypothetical protein